MYRTGLGFDLHRFSEGDFITIGGIKIPLNKGIEAHSDGDILIHAVVDAILGALALGDIGEFFPDNDSQYKNMSSSYFLQIAQKMIVEKGYSIVNIDSTIILEEPKISPYKKEIRENMAYLLHMNVEDINVKAKTSEGLFFIGKKQGLAANAIVLLEKIPD